MDLNSQVYIPPSVARKGEKWREMVSVEPLITYILDEVCVLVMVSEPFFQSAVAVLQERVSDCMAYCCLVAAAAHVNSTNGDHCSGCATAEGYIMMT